MKMSCYKKDAPLRLGFFCFFSLLISSVLIGTSTATRPSDVSLAETDAYERSWFGGDPSYSLEDDRDLHYGGQDSSSSAVQSNFRHLDPNYYDRQSRGSDLLGGNGNLGRNFLRFGRGKLGSNFIRFGRVRGDMFQDGGQDQALDGALSDKRGQLNKNFLRFGRSQEDQGPPRRVKRHASFSQQSSPTKRVIRVRTPRRINGGIVDGGKRDALYRNFLRFGKRTTVEENCDPNDHENGQCPDPLTFETQPVAKGSVEVVYNRTLPKRSFLWLTFSTNRHRRHKPMKFLVGVDKASRLGHLIENYLRFG